MLKLLHLNWFYLGGGCEGVAGSHRVPGSPGIHPIAEEGLKFPSAGITGEAAMLSTPGNRVRGWRDGSVIRSTYCSCEDFSTHVKCPQLPVPPALRI